MGDCPVLSEGKKHMLLNLADVPISTVPDRRGDQNITRVKNSGGKPSCSTLRATHVNAVDHRLLSVLEIFDDEQQRPRLSDFQ